MSLTDTTSTALVQATRGMALRSLQADAVKAAQARAETLRGLVVSTEDGAAEVVDTLKGIVAGRKWLEERRRILCSPHDSAKAAVRDTLAPVIQALMDGETQGKRVIQQFRETARRQYEENVRRAREEAEAAARKAAAEAPDEDVPPPGEVDFVPGAPPPQVRGSAGIGMVSESSVLEAALVNQHEVDPTWLKLDTGAAKAAFRSQQRDAQEALLAGQWKDFIWRGVRFTYRRNEVVR